MKDLVERYRKEIAGALGVLALVWVHNTFIVGGTIERIAELTRQIEAQEAILPSTREIMKMAEEIESLSKPVQGAELTGDTLATAIEQIKNRLGIGNKLQRLRPKQVEDVDSKLRVEWVELAFAQLNLKNLIDFLQAIESLGPAVRINKLTIRKQGDLAILEMTVKAIRLSA